MFLHVGTPKSGTTYLQTLLWEKRAALREAGLCYPGQWYESQFLAALDALQFVFGDANRPDVDGAWTRIVEEIRAHGGNAVVSHELLARAEPERIDRILDDLSFADVHLILTTRDLGRQIPAVWQEDVKNRRSASYADYLAALRETAQAVSVSADAFDAQARRLELEPGLTAQIDDFWALQHVVEILARWSRNVPGERVHVVTIPSSGADRGLLWQRFAGVLGIDPAAFEADGIETNESLGAEDVSLIRRLNVFMGDTVDWMTYERWVKVFLANRVLAGESRSKTKFGIPADDLAWVTTLAESMIADLRTAGYQVVGDLAELLPAPRDAGHDPDDMPAEAVVESALRAMTGLVKRLGETQGHLTRTEERLRETEERLRAADAQLAELRDALEAAYERPVLRQLAHKITPLRPVLRLGVAVRDRYAEEPGPDGERAGSAGEQAGRP